MKLFLISVFAGIVILCHNMACAQQGIIFHDLTLSQAMSRAADEKDPKLIFVDCYTSWCVPCLEMSRMEFPKQVCGDYFNPRFVSVKFDMEKGEGIEIKKKYNVTAYPTFLILNTKGEEINRLVGKAGAEEFIEKVKAALDPKNSLTGLRAAYEEKKNMSTGLPYAEALIQNSRDPLPVLDYLYDHSMDFERFSTSYLDLVFGAVKFGSPLFRKVLLDKVRLDQALGTEVINKIIFDKIRKDMYCIATETGARYNVFYTPEQVEEIAYTIALLKLPSDDAQNHICRIALYVVNKDMDGLIAYYKRYIRQLPSDNAFKGILDGILMSKAPRATEAQKAAIKEYFQHVAGSLEKEAGHYRNTADNIK